jgi:hypothetical protein
LGGNQRTKIRCISPFQSNPLQISLFKISWTIAEVTWLENNCKEDQFDPPVPSNRRTNFWVIAELHGCSGRNKSRLDGYHR